MPDKVWKKQERRIAKKFGTSRTPLSGSRSLHTGSDIIHPKLYVECKYRKRISVLDEFPGVAKRAKEENKIPVMAIKSRELKDDFFLIRAKDLEEVAKELKAAMPKIHVKVGDDTNDSE